ncbi:MAG: methylated-DNA--[protein]-cysteine S-methyltransferase [Deltaproteobacteria bacterium]|nr:methylated-DNA--[protein]-cysteine S-methyltransferase [Deltaproteobacteria bacterium]
MIVKYAIYSSALSNIALLAMDGKLFEMKLSEENEISIKKDILKRFPGASNDENEFKRLRILLERYFAGDRVDFFDIELILPFSTSFTKAVLLQVRKIPYGETRSYSWIAENLGYKTTARPIGQALKKNPIPIIIPCHRVIEKSGKIGGFSIGTHIKKRLLEIEGINLIG